jgi:serine phosphatase RsbU (regulator of sigma subunit)/anti-sigma regulatory factor (Ser/Thr protein kinase)
VVTAMAVDRLGGALRTGPTGRGRAGPLRATGTSRIDRYRDAIETRGDQQGGRAVETWTDVQGDLADAGRARRFVEGLLEREGIDAVLLDDAVLCASEAVTNALRHAGGLRAIRVAVGQTVLRVEVEDDEPGDLEVRHPDLDSTSGRGLLIIDAVAHRWGVEPTEGGGKAVWFELDRAAAGPAGDDEADQVRRRHRLRPWQVTALAGLGGVALALPAGSWTAGQGQPEPALMVLGAALVLAATVAGGFGAGLATTLALGVATVAFHRDGRLAADLSAPVLVLGVLGVGLMVATFAWATIELRARARVRTRLFKRLADLSDELAATAHGHDAVSEVERLAATAANADSARIFTVLPSVAEAGSRPTSTVLALPGPQRYRSIELRSPRVPGLLPDAEANDFLRSIADRCAQTLQRVELQQAERRARSDVEVLADASRVLSESLSVDRVIAALRSIVVPRLADRCAVVLDRPRRPGTPAGPGEAVPEPGDTPGVMAIELRSRGRRLGRFVASRHGSDFDDEDRALLAELAARAAVALDNAQVYEEQAQTSGVLEGSLLPHALLPMEHLEVGARYLAATAATGHLVGGDFYDAIRTDDRVVLLVGDVQGKGVEAATLTAVARHTLRAAALAGDGPATMLSRVNDALRYHEAERATVEDDPTVRFITAAVVQLVRSGDGFDALVACGGHPYPVVVRAAGDVEVIKASGPLLGVFDHADCDEVDLRLDLADVLVLYTDGVIEHRAADDLFDEAQLGRLVRNQLTVTRADELAQVVLDTVVALSPTEHRDDIAVLVARVTRE